MIFEDKHLLVVSKPAGWNTHSPSPHAGEGIYEWLRHREPAWASLAILHRLDKETSGVLVFGKSPLANRTLTQQFTEHGIRKRYLLLTDRPVPHQRWTVKTRLARTGSRYASIPDTQSGELAETRFGVVSNEQDCTLLDAEPLTGRTHQIRVHAAESGIPVLGDTLYGGSMFQRVCLHAASIQLAHPVSGEPCRFDAPVDFESRARWLLRSAFIDPTQTDAFRLIHGAADGWPGWYVDRLGGFLLSQAEQDLTDKHRAELERLLSLLGGRGAYHKCLQKHVRCTIPGQASPRLILGEAAPERFPITENGLSFELSFREGYSVGLFLDQRDNRRRLLTSHVAADFPLVNTGTGNRLLEVLNLFAYTCGFSVCAARAGMRVTSVDLSRKHLDWGHRNFELNGLNPAVHDFICGDAFDWTKRLHRKKRTFDVIILDPPTFSQSKQSGVFRAEKDSGKLVRSAMSLLKPNGIVLASTNAVNWAPPQFLESMRSAITSQGRRVLREHYYPQPPDFPVTRQEPAFLKTAWFLTG